MKNFILKSLFLTIISLVSFFCQANAQNYVRLINAWQKDGVTNYTINTQGPSVDAGAVESGWWSAQWTLEKVTGTNFYTIKNRWKKDGKTSYYLYHKGGSLVAGGIVPNELAAQWILEPANNNTFRIKNRQTSSYLHIQASHLTAGEIQPNWLSAIWKLEGFKGGQVTPTPTSTPKAKYFTERDLNSDHILGTQAATKHQAPRTNMSAAQWNYRGNLSRKEINANGLGRCYDIRNLDLLNWADETLSGGQSANVFNFFRDDANRPAYLNGQQLVVPFGVTFQSDIKADAEEQFKFIVTGHEFESEVLQEYRANIGVPKVGSAKASAAFKNSSSVSNNNESLSTFSKMYKQLYKLDINLDNPSYQHQINARFWKAVHDLGNGLSANAFIAKFGTHYASTAYYGGNYLQRFSVNKSEFATSARSEREFKLDVEGTIKGVNVGAGTTQGRTQGSKNYKSVTVSNKKVYTVGGDLSVHDPAAWAKTVERRPEVIKGRLTRITELLTKEFFPNITDIDNKRRLLEVAIKQAENTASRQLSRPVNHSFYSKTPVTFQLTVYTMTCYGQGSGEPGSESEYYGKLAMGHFSGNRKQLGGQWFWDRNSDNTLSLSTNETEDIRTEQGKMYISTMTIYPKDFADGYAKIWGYMKENDSPDTQLSDYSESATQGQIHYSSAMGFNKIPGLLSFTSTSGDSVEISYELQRIK